MSRMPKCLPTINGSDPDFTMLDVRPGEAHDLRVLPGGSVAKPGELAPRGFPAVLAKGDPVWYLVPDGVVRYIDKRELYRGE